MCPPTPPTTTWETSIFPDADTQLSEAWAVTTDGDGSVFAAGCGGFYGCADYTHGSGPCFVLKANSSGHYMFVDRYDYGVMEDLTVALAPDGRGGVVMGIANDEGLDFGGAQPQGCVVLRIDGDGNILFSHPLPGAYCTTTFITATDQGRPFAFAGDGNGRSLLVGVCGDACEGQDGAVALYLDELGNTLAKNVFVGMGANMRLEAAALLTDGSSFIGGFEQGGVDFGDGTKGVGESAAMAAFDPSHKLVKDLFVGDDLVGMQAIPAADGNGYVVAGTIDRVGIDLGGGPLPYSGSGPNAGLNTDVFLAGFTTQLEHVFSNAYGDTSAQYTTSLCTDPDGTITWVGEAGYVTRFGNLTPVSGDPTTPDDGFLVRMSPRGVPVAIGNPQPDLGLEQIGCVPGEYVMVGKAAVQTTSFLSQPVAPGGFIVKAPR
jgi:hypothetical protein